MLPTPKKYFLTAAAAEGRSRLTAFDNALLNARIGNLNLIRVSSILPPDVELDNNLDIPPGSLVPTAYGSIISDIPGELIAAAVAVGISEDSYGVIMEFSGKCSKEEAEDTVTAMVREAFEVRRKQLKEIKVAVVDHRVEKTGCCLAAIPLWY
ncbi:Pyruvoyl-dependent arginine decarboxylase [Desulfotomaculum nigrificans CO-1-SRB]|uniref:Pyruvoyl-dependent arginine decarboxylase AaxB n=1 Tax=Desulfotomaculum nigrificans (strain DSM 14880 / VKM B-2319 / CO-1-SRB) TaxID=868595 RepID=F6B316_DESCC|nr:arginine decarboxylase, pyruvoyl-dependent [Desulfotomaculum nigrificans]AEF93920.1 Pyruvoyl-dependent arginine decarboxylase [Desulfotomaculum nigrificans CO-1-SRB]